MIIRTVTILILSAWVIASVAIAQSKSAEVNLSFDSWNAVYSSTLGLPVYIAWDVSRDDIGSVKREPSMPFRTDPRLGPDAVRSSDYSRSGYHRGHMVPAADRSSSMAAMQATFIMTNVCPQIPALNTGEWRKMENYERVAALRLGRVHIRVAPIFIHSDTSRIANGRVAVPHGFIKVIYAADSMSVIACQLFTNQHD